MEENYDVKSAGRIFSRIGFAVLTILVVGSIVQLIAVLVPAKIWGEDHWLLSSSWGMWISTFVPLYLVAVPIGLLIFRRIPAAAPQEQKLRVSDFVIYLLIGYCLMYAGNIVGTVLSLVLSGGTAENALTNYAMDNNPLKILVIVILAPMIEEYIFRKKIIDCTGIYGEKTAVILSGFLFGLFHGNLYRFFYVFLLGILFAYVYIRTGRLRYSVVMHMIINFMGSVVAPFVLSMVNMEAIEQINLMDVAGVMTLLRDVIPGLMLYLSYSAVIMGAATGGLVLLILRWKSAVWKENALELPKKQRIRAVYLNVGMILYMISCLILMVLALF